MKTSSLLGLALAAMASGAALPAWAQETVCAKVFIEIRQEVALARQAFEARMGINNALPTDLTNVQVTVKFATEDGTPVAGTTATVNDPSAYFFFRKDVSPPGTSGQPHPTGVAAGTTQSLVWTIIPTLTAANGTDVTSAGTVYQVGAELKYTTAGKEETIVVSPDFIRVKPLPEIQLDYFLPYDVSGDDPMTPVAEPPVPFPLALRARNIGKGIARQLTVESAPPKIVRNDLDAPVQFTIHSTKVNDGPVTPGLLVSAGDVGSGVSSMMRWEMRSRLSGRFTAFTADIAHSDELGGVLTAVIRDVATRRLEGEVLVDLPGRDGIVDFLGFDSMTSESSALRVYESQMVNPAVAAILENVLVPPANINLSASFNSGVIALGNSSPTGSAFSYVRAADPWSGTRKVKRVLRSDGKLLPAQNAWLSRRYEPTTPGGTPLTLFRVHVFDHLPANTGPVSWAVEFEDAGSGNLAPVFGPLSSRIVKHGQEVTFPVSASDPEAQLIAVNLPVRPYGSIFTTDNDGAGTFTWTPGGQGVPQTGDFPLTFTASDGQATSSRTVVLTVTSGSLLDAWKSRWWSPGDPESANSADPDGDGLMNLYEYALEMDPTRSSTHQRPVLTRVQQGGKHHLALTALYRTDDPDLIVDVVASSDPSQADAAWTPLPSGMPVDPATTPPGFLRARFVDTVALEDSSTGRYVRLRVRLAP